MEEIVKLINERKRYKYQNNIENQQNYKRIKNNTKKNSKGLDNQCITVEEYIKMEKVI